mgnify:CR=1 FL=1
MSFFEDKVVISARYTNDDHTNVEVIWREKDGDPSQAFPYNINSEDFNNIDLKYLATIGLDSEQIYRNTLTANAEAYRIMQKRRMAELQEALKGMLDEGSVDVSQFPVFQEMEREYEAQITDLKHIISSRPSAETTSWYEQLVKINKDEDQIFKLKLALLDKHKDELSKTEKTAIRKAKTIAETIGLIGHLELKE